MQFQPAEANILLIVLLSFLGALVGLVISSLLNALWLMLANFWLGATELDYGRAFKAVFMSQFVIGMLGWSVSLAFCSIVVLEGNARDVAETIRRSLVFLFHPHVLLEYTVATVLVHALV